MNTIRLYGRLAKEFGPSHRFEIQSPAEAFQALAANYPRFIQLLRHGFYRVVIGKTQAKGEVLDENTITRQHIGTEDIHIIPVIKGRGRGGLGKVLAGLLLVGLAMFGGPIMATTLGAGGSMTLGSAVGHIGVGLTLSGVATMLAPQMDGSESEKSFTMTGPQVTLREGGIVPIVYGECVTGGTMISGILRIDNAVDVNSTTVATILPVL
ncbi:tail assembly protein [Pseudorhodobacter sp. MZDSW-24AT]|uniref:tail assembly protein n=1 Tax=Pseudorhodobacter sp. MZDSW-24AT TaxID=2052957 RepID=UPI000C1F7D62|nr:tail assembly protein [Pseudorhodobacter sp. MZDSW-24AT]PJF10785.1 hypothetical protein CUR21_02180 [Pseudorhodobacter sp. MZDSW-24AT]